MLRVFKKLPVLQGEFQDKDVVVIDYNEDDGLQFIKKEELVVEVPAQNVELENLVADRTLELRRRVDQLRRQNVLGLCLLDAAQHHPPRARSVGNHRCR